MDFNRPRIGTGTIWRHEKTKHNYVVTGHCIIEKSGVAAVLYRRYPGGMVDWCRPTEEFLDGRFTKVEEGQ
jgi:hypothetical protein